MADLLGKTGRRVEVEFAAPVDPRELSQLPGVSDVKADGARVRLRVAGEIDPVVKAIAAHPVIELEFSRPTLEEVFLTYYEEGGP